MSRTKYQFELLGMWGGCGDKAIFALARLFVNSCWRVFPLSVGTHQQNINLSKYAMINMNCNLNIKQYRRCGEGVRDHRLDHKLEVVSTDMHTICILPSHFCHRIRNFYPKSCKTVEFFRSQNMFVILYPRLSEQCSYWKVVLLVYLVEIRRLLFV